MERRPLGLAVAVIIWLISPLGDVLGDCRFPDKWLGRWYQSNLGDVTIGSNRITPKGVCNDRHSEYYLLENSDQHCHQCLLILQRHPNVLQYKESYCIGRSSLQSICGQIRVESVLYTLVREPSIPAPCPFTDAYHFTYNNNSGGFCRSPMSYAHQCSATSHFHFRFNQCRQPAFTYDREVEFRCLAHWKDGSDLFLYGAFAGTGLMNKDDIYRCFMYQVLDTVVYLSVSADATCRGLRTPRDGPLVVEFTKDVIGWPEPSCQFPRWLTDSEWRDLSGRHTYVTDSTSAVIRLSYKHKHNISAHVQSSFTCKSSTDVAANGTRRVGFMAVTHTLENCEARYRCIRVLQRYDGPEILEFERGEYVHEHFTECTERHFRSAVTHILIRSHQPDVTCPMLPGRFLAPPDISSCQLEMRMRCEQNSSLVLASSCQSQPLVTLQCLGYWYTGDVITFIGEDLESGLVNCFYLNHLNGELELGLKEDCNIGVSPILNGNMPITFNGQSDRCHGTQTPPPLEDARRHLPGPNDDPGGGYSHVIPELKPPSSTPKREKQQTNFQIATASSASGLPLYLAGQTFLTSLLKPLVLTLCLLLAVPDR